MAACYGASNGLGEGAEGLAIVRFNRYRGGLGCTWPFAGSHGTAPREGESQRCSELNGK